TPSRAPRRGTSPVNCRPAPSTASSGTCRGWRAARASGRPGSPGTGRSPVHRRRGGAPTGTRSTGPGTYGSWLSAASGSAALPRPDVVAERPVLRPVPVDRPGHEALQVAAERVPALGQRRRRHVAATGARLRGQPGYLLVERNLDRGALHDQPAVEAVGLHREPLDRGRRVRVAGAAVHVAVVVLHVQPPQPAVVHV